MLCLPTMLWWTPAQERKVFWESRAPSLHALGTPVWNAERLGNAGLHSALEGVHPCPGSLRVLESRARLCACAALLTAAQRQQRFQKPKRFLWHLRCREQPEADPGKLPPECGQLGPAPLDRSLPLLSAAQALPLGLQGRQGSRGLCLSLCSWPSSPHPHPQPLRTTGETWTTCTFAGPGSSRVPCACPSPRL